MPQLKPRWSTPLTEPVTPKDGKPMHTLKDVNAYILKNIPRKRLGDKKDRWYVLGTHLLNVAEGRDDDVATLTLHVMRALLHENRLKLT